MDKMLQASILTGGSSAALYERAGELAALAQCEAPRNGAACGHCRACRKVREGIHPDVITVERRGEPGRQKREIVVEQIRLLAADAQILPNEGRYKIYILREAETLNIPAQNAFLKLLEEPPAGVLFFLCAENSARLLPTIRSRCALLRLGHREAEAPGAEAAGAEKLLSALPEPAELLRCCTALEKLDAGALRELLEAAREAAAERFAPGPALLELEAELERCCAYLRQNVSVKHVLGMLSCYEMRGDLCKK